MLPGARFYSAFSPLSRAGDKITDVSRPCNCGQHRRIISTSLSGLVPLLPTCFQLLPICTGQDHFTVWKFNFTEFQAGCQGFRAFNFCPSFPDGSLRKQLFIFYRSAVSGQPGCHASGNGRYYTPPTTLVKGFHDQFPILVSVCLTYSGFSPGTSFTVTPSFLNNSGVC